MTDKMNYVPQKSNIRIKEQEGAYVIFNLETSGFHRVTQDVYEVLEKMDGNQTIAELARFFSEKRGLDFNVFKNQLASFLEELELRKIVVLNGKE